MGSKVAQTCRAGTCLHYTGAPTVRIPATNQVIWEAIVYVLMGKHCMTFNACLLWELHPRFSSWRVKVEQPRCHLLSSMHGQWRLCRRSPEARLQCWGKCRDPGPNREPNWLPSSRVWPQLPLLVSGHQRDACRTVKSFHWIISGVFLWICSEVISMVTHWPTWVLAMPWCCQATSYYLNQFVEQVPLCMATPGTNGLTHWLKYHNITFKLLYFD